MVMGLTDLIEISDFLGDFVINNLRVRIPLLLSQFMKDKNKDYLYYCWESDKDGNPTGPEKYLRSNQKETVSNIYRLVSVEKRGLRKFYSDCRMVIFGVQLA